MAAPRWTDRDTEGTYWELLRDRKVSAEVVVESESGRWLWYVRMPIGWDNGRNPSGAANSCEAAKAICETILAGTVEK
jgi:hypothetical protein